MSVWVTGGLQHPKACLGTESLNGVLGLVRVTLMGSRGVHGVAAKVRNTATKVH